MLLAASLAFALWTQQGSLPVTPPLSHQRVSRQEKYLVIAHSDTSRFNCSSVEELMKEMNAWADRGWEFVDVKIIKTQPSTYNPNRYTLRSAHADAVAYYLRRKD